MPYRAPLRIKTMGAPTILEKRPLSPQVKTPLGDDLATSPAKRRRVFMADKQYAEELENPTSPAVTDPNARKLAETVAFVERAFSSWKAFEDELLPIECHCAPLRGRSDYRIWSRKIKMILKRHCVLDLVEGRIGQLPQSHPLDRDLERLNATAAMIITRNLSALTKPMVRTMTNPRAMWEKLERHCKPSDWSLAQTGWMNLQNIKYSRCSGVRDYVEQMDDAWRSISLDKDEIFENHEIARCASLVFALDTPKWETWKTNVLSGRQANIPSWANLVDKLFAAEFK
ncbi:unnamed protein product [Penicillium salamii]|uniref:Uncharacterized protein n=1 Tax=Penicillium salamii TaxID=1612424 RepID=A0A9W4J0J5_9EURO|nr:unnamed protein product [Penicillium salamii]CAG8362157.1 unnamed protein product [Penicillium salamii]CAG8393177.1 unnamed protein product [Penicillium salamii]